MTRFMTSAEYNEMENTIFDEETGMTVLDLWEYSHPYDEIEIVD